MAIAEDVIEETRRLVAAGAAKGIQLRLLGGMAVKLHCPSASHRALERKYPDIDFVVRTKDGSAVGPFLLGEGYTENKTLNTLSGAERQLYYDVPNNRQIDVFIGGFSMCHKLRLADRLAVEPLTVPLAELFLTKAQIVALNRKDVLDLVAVLADHEVGPGDAETINSVVIADLCAKEWGLFTTVSLNLQKVADILAQGGIELDESQMSLVTGRLASLKGALDDAPKSLAWKMRAKIGTRVRWYDEVEEVRR